jgi:hypothetical protein
LEGVVYLCCRSQTPRDADLLIAILYKSYAQGANIKSMYSPKSPAIAAFTIVFLLLTLVQSIDAQAGPAVERNAEARFPPTPQSKNFARLDDLLERKRKRSMNGQEETFLGSIDPAPPCDESMKVSYALSHSTANLTTYLGTTQSSSRHIHSIALIDVNTKLDLSSSRSTYKTIRTVCLYRVWLFTRVPTMLRGRKL